MNQIRDDRQKPVQAGWRKSSHSGSGDQCVEVAALPGGRRALRDSKDVRGPALVLSGAAWRAFIEFTDPR